MRANLAKHNPLILDQAIKHYLNHRKPTPEFTFMSLWDDSEPYPLTEVMNVAGERLALLQARFKERPTDSLARLLSNARKRLAGLQNLQHKEAE